MKNENKATTEKPDEKAKKITPNTKAAVDFSKLDLGVEKVEERISPNETNVFDK